MYINLKKWTLCADGYPELHAETPCSMYSALLAEKLIDNPFFGGNEEKITKLSEKDCVFKTEFEISEDFENKNAILRFNGLDTLCDITLNGCPVCSTDNMHRRYDIECAKYLRSGKNQISIYFHSPLEYVKRADARTKLFVNPDSTPGAAHIRKASYMFGWDWGPTLPDMGIFRDAELFIFSGAMLDNLFITQKHTPDGVVLAVTPEYVGGDCADDTVVTLEGHGMSESCKPSFGKCEFVIKNPKLWWPRGYGDQPLYKIKASNKNGSIEKKIGLRTILLDTENDKHGSRFCFKVNGIDIFAMGANVIPQNSILPNVTHLNIESLVKSCEDANFNMIRIWGGGIYPDDYLYELCDEKGILIWQDFMFACIFIRLYDDFEKSVRAECIDNVRRLRHHACLALLCGNNENEQGLSNFGSFADRTDYVTLFERIIPSICMKYAPEVSYRPSSPSSGGGFENVDDPNCGDQHFWEVWFMGKPFSEYRKYKFRFCSEFGFESYPSIKTIREFAGEDAMNPFSKAVDHHQKCNDGNVRIISYAAREYLYAYSFEELVYISQMNQANAIRYGVEHFRRFRGICMGSLYWQLNDCWPCVSWSSVDKNGRRKALHYKSAEFYAPVLLSAHIDEYSAVFNISNETRKTFEGRAEIGIYDKDFTEVYSRSVDVTVSALSSEDFSVLDAEKYVRGNEQTRFVRYALYASDGTLISEKSEIFTKPKYFDYSVPHISVKSEQNGENISITVSADTYVSGLEIDLKSADAVFDRNFFNILSPSPVTVSGTCSGNFKSDDIILRCINNIGRKRECER